MEGRRQLELRFEEALASNQRLTRDMEEREQRFQELSAAVASLRGQLEDVMGRFTQETRSGQELRMRLATRDQQIDQLQDELAMLLQAGGSAAVSRPASPVELNRIVVTNADAAAIHGRVISVHPDWNFLVLDLGWNAVKLGDTVSIYRDEQLLAKARIDRVQEGVCAATILPEWERTEIRINDRVRLL